MRAVYSSVVCTAAVFEIVSMPTHEPKVATSAASIAVLASKTAPGTAELIWWSTRMLAADRSIRMSPGKISCRLAARAATYATRSKLATSPLMYEVKEIVSRYTPPGGAGRGLGGGGSGTGGGEGEGGGMGEAAVDVATAKLPAAMPPSTASRRSHRFHLLGCLVVASTFTCLFPLRAASRVENSNVSRVTTGSCFCRKRENRREADTDSEKPVPLFRMGGAAASTTSLTSDSGTVVVPSALRVLPRGHSTYERFEPKSTSASNTPGLDVSNSSPSFSIRIGMIGLVTPFFFAFGWTVVRQYWSSLYVHAGFPVSSP